MNIAELHLRFSVSLNYEAEQKSINFIAKNLLYKESVRISYYVYSFFNTNHVLGNELLNKEMSTMVNASLLMFVSLNEIVLKSK